MDIWGVAGVEAEAELLSAIVASMQDMGLTAQDVGIKVNSRKILNGLMTKVGEDPRGQVGGDMHLGGQAGEGIYGWNIDTGLIVFQISRHSDNITDFIAVDHLNVFITCAMDKKIVMWSSTSRRVKGILTGHQRGVRSLS
eukprot:gene57682-79037_t